MPSVEFYWGIAGVTATVIGIALDFLFKMWRASRQEGERFQKRFALALTCLFGLIGIVLLTYLSKNLGEIWFNLLYGLIAIAICAIGFGIYFKTIRE